MTAPLRSVAIIGAGINGLVAANYLRRAGLEVTLLEQKPWVGGAAMTKTKSLFKETYQFSPGASVLGMMQDFVFRETGLSDMVQTHVPRSGPFYSFGDNDVLLPKPQGADDPTISRWGVRPGDANVRALFEDLEQVERYLAQGYKDAATPSREHAQAVLGTQLTRRWILGSARDALDHYDVPEELKVMLASSVSESGPVSLNESMTAFTIPLMRSGTIFDGAWGYVQGGMGQLTATLGAINDALGVRTLTQHRVLSIGANATIHYAREDAAGTLAADVILFATTPHAAANILGDERLQDRIANMQSRGTAGKFMVFSPKPIVWGDVHVDATGALPPEANSAIRMHYMVDNLDKLERQTRAAQTHNVFDFVPTSIQMYPEDERVLAVYATHFPTDKSGVELRCARETLANLIGGRIRGGHTIAQRLYAPVNLERRFGCTNIDHLEIKQGQTFDERTLSENPDAFFQLGKHERVFYCGSGAYPCGSVAGTAGYMAAMQLLDAHKIQRPNGTRPQAF